MPYQKFSVTRNLYSYAKAITTFVRNNALQNRFYKDKEVITIFLSHLDDTTYTSAIKECMMTLLLSPTVDSIYLVPTIAWTINQLTIPSTTATNQDQKRGPSGHICALEDYVSDDYLTANEYCQYTDNCVETPLVRELQFGDGRALIPVVKDLVVEAVVCFQGGRGKPQQQKASFKMKCKACR